MGAKWTESLDGNRGYLDDGLAGLGEEKFGEVDARVTSKGIFYLSDCKFCQRQMKTAFPWGEVLAFKGRQPIVPNTRYVQQGVLFTMACKCNKITPVVFSWSDIDAYVQQGVAMRVLDPRFLRTG